MLVRVLTVSSDVVITCHVITVTSSTSLVLVCVIIVGVLLSGILEVNYETNPRGYLNCVVPETYGLKFKYGWN